ncbi:MAG: substrate-binding domain-containing protein [Bacteroidota bacterium]
MQRKKVTVADIAKELDLSWVTVDRVLNNRGGVSEKTKQRVLEMVEKLGYTANRAAKHLAKKTKCTIGVSYSLPDWFREQIDRGINKAYYELKDFGANVMIRVAPKSAEEQIAQIREMLPEIDALAVTPWEPSIFSNFLDELVDGGLPVATFNIDVPGSKRLFYIGCSYLESGRLCGELITKLVHRPGKVAVVTNKNYLTHLEQRITGFREVLSRKKEMKIIGPLKIDEYDPSSAAAIKQCVEDNPDLAAIYHVCTNMELSANVIKETGNAGRIKLVGFDVNDRYHQLIMEDVIQAVVCQEPFDQGYFPIKILFEFVAEGRWPATTEVLTPLEIIMRENLKYFYNYQHPIG